MNSPHLSSRVHSAGSVDSITKETVTGQFGAYDSSHYWTRVDANHQLHSTCMQACLFILQCIPNLLSHYPHSLGYYRILEACAVEPPLTPQPWTCDITDNSECPDHISLQLNPLYSEHPTNGHLLWSCLSLHNSK